jgi:activating molecule in BECN1-regulated autophagy protein 1
MVAYGRRHSSLLLLVADGTRCVTVHTVLELYDSRDMNLTHSLASVEDEVNVALFHPHQGGGVADGTKEGKLRVVRHDRVNVFEEDEEEKEKGGKQRQRDHPTAVGTCLRDELLETLRWSEDEGSDDEVLDELSEDGSDDRSNDGR